MTTLSRSLLNEWPRAIRRGPAPRHHRPLLRDRGRQRWRLLRLDRIGRSKDEFAGTTAGPPGPPGRVGPPSRAGQGPHASMEEQEWELVQLCVYGIASLYERYPPRMSGAIATLKEAGAAQKPGANPPPRLQRSRARRREVVGNAARSHKGAARHRNETNSLTIGRVHRPLCGGV